MRSFLAFLVLLVLAGGAYLLLRPEQIQRPATPPSRPGEAAPPKAGEGPASRAKPPNPGAEPDREGWAAFRPPVERLVPDPDGIGPCPPVHLGGMPARVVRRFVRRSNGFQVWVHEDGSETWVHYQTAKDPGREKPVTRRIVSSAQPYRPVPFPPQDRE